LKSFPILELNKAKRVPLSILPTAKRNHLIRKRIFYVIYVSWRGESSCSLGFPGEGGPSPHGRVEERSATGGDDLAADEGTGADRGALELRRRLAVLVVELPLLLQIAVGLL
jgi:hypothetical protein